MADESMIFANGVDPSGEYLVPGIAPADLPAVARGERHPSNEQNRWQITREVIVTRPRSAAA